MKAKVPELITLDSHHERVEYLDMICLMALHRAFGFGPARLRRYYDAITETDKHYKRYNSNQEPLFGRKTRDGHQRMDLWKVKKDLMDIGFDYDEVVKEEEDAKET